MEKGKWEKLFGAYKYVLLVLLAGLLLLLWPSNEGTEAGGTSTEQVVEIPPTAWELETLRQEMEEILSAIDGVGSLRIMLTLENDGEKKLAGDSSLHYSGVAASPDDYERRAETVILSQPGSGQEVVVVEEGSPIFRGALVVCEGGDIASVRLALIEAISALTGLGADKISVVKSNGVEVSKG